LNGDVIAEFISSKKCIRYLFPKRCNS